MKKYIYLSLVTIPLLLSAENITLDSIEVNAQLSRSDGEVLYDKEGYMKAAPMQKQITSKQALEIAGTNGDPIKALKSFAGVVSTNNDEGSEIYVHGSKPRETRFSLNHLPMGYLFHFGGLHSVVAPEMVGQIDAYLGGFDVTYGAMGAVVDITPTYPTGSGKGRVHIGMYDADFAYDMRLGEDTNLFISARRSYFDLIADKLIEEFDTDKDDERKKTSFTLFPQFYDAQLVLTHNVGNHAFSLEMLAAQDKFKVKDTFNVEKDPLAVGKLNINIKSNTVGARWLYAGDDMTSNTLIYRLFTKQNAEFYDADYFLDTKEEEYGLYHETVVNLDAHTLTLGGEFKLVNAPTKIHSNAPGTTDFEDVITEQEVIDIDKTFKAKEYTLFAQDIWDITSSNHLRYGVRVWKTDFQNFGSGIDPRIAYVHDFTNDFTVSAAVGKYSQRPSTFTTIKGFGNPQIDTQESSDHFTLSFQKTFSDKSSLVVEPYFKKFQNLAVTDDLNNYEAVGEGKAYGVDVTYRKKIEDFNFMLAYTYVNAKRQLNTDNKKQYRFEGDIPHTLQLTTTYHFWNSWKVSSYFKYNSGAPYTPIVGTTPYIYEGKEYVKPIYGKPYSKRLDDNYDLDVQIGKTYKYANGKSLEVSLELMNINALFKKNVESIKYNDKYEEVGTENHLGFLPALHLTYRF